MLPQLNDNFVEQINETYYNFYTYDAIQEGVVKLKTDMLSVLSIAVDYVDADGINNNGKKLLILFVVGLLRLILFITNYIYKTAVFDQH